MKPASSQRSLQRSLRNHLVLGVAAVVVLLGAIGGWAATTELSGAIIASGILTVEGNAKEIQHPTGGVVAELLVQEGQRVEAGSVLVRLDPTLMQANLAVVTKSLNQLYARLARLETERDDLPGIVVPDALIARLTPEQAESEIQSERWLFEQRRASRNGQKEQLRERIVQLREQISGHSAQQVAKSDEIGLVDKELAGVQALLDKGLTSIDRVNNLARAAARLRGERGQLFAAVADARGKIAEIELQILQVDQTLRNEIATELRDLQNRLGELVEREVAALDQLKRIEVKAPISGTIHQLAIHTVGGVITPAEDLMHIVPQGSDLTVEARIAPQDIDQIMIGQSAVLHLTAFNRNTTPELAGKVIRISADLVTDSKTGMNFYRAGIAIPKSELVRIPSLTLVPGMPVESFIQTGKRTVISYLAKPIKDHAFRVFREE